MARSKKQKNRKKIHNGGTGEAAKETDEPTTLLSFTVKESPRFGRFLEAAKNLAAGEEILKDKPIVIGPSQDSESICIGCYDSITYNDICYRCKDCAFPLCSSKCAGIGRTWGHSVRECSVFARCDVKQLSSFELSSHLEAVTPLRCLILENFDLQSWNILLKMESHTETRKEISSIWDNNQRKVVDVIRQKWNLRTFDEDLIHRICGILEVNAFEVGSGLRGLYPNAYLFAHNCVPNTKHSDDAEFGVTFWTTLPVPIGQMFTVTYTYILQGTSKRRKHLKDTKFFDCHCERCKDATELGTNISALKCPVCKHGLVECKDPLQTDSKWSCQSSNCSGYVISGTMVDNITQRIFVELDAIDGNDIKSYEAFLEKYNNTLHSSHYLCLSAMHCLFQLYGKIKGYLITDISDKDLTRKADICTNLLEVFDKLEPGLSKQRGLIMYELQAALMVLLQRHHHARQIGKIEMKEKLRLITKYLDESQRILKVEPIGSKEAAIAAAAADALTNLFTWRELIKKF